MRLSALSAAHEARMLHFSRWAPRGGGLALATAPGEGNALPYSECFLADFERRH